LGKAEAMRALRKRILGRLIHEWIRRGIKNVSIWNQVLNIKGGTDAKVWWEIHHIAFELIFLRIQNGSALYACNFFTVPGENRSSLMRTII